MNRLKQILKIFTLFVLLIVVVAVPLPLMNLDKERMINQLNIVTMQAESMEHIEEPSSNYNTEERLRIIANAKNSKTGAVTEQQISSLSDDEQRNLLLSIEAQFTILQNLGALPNIDFPEKYNISIAKTTFIDTLNPNNAVSIWYIDIINPDYYVSVDMDAKTSTLYQVTIISKTGTLDYDPNQISIMSFLDYLKLNPQKLNWQSDKFDVKGYIFDNNIPIYHYEKSQNIIQYQVDTTMNYSLTTDDTIFIQ